MHTKLDLQQRIDVWMFARKLPDYYADMAQLLESTQELRQLDIFLQDALRYEGTPRGRLSAAWAERHEINGADLASTWQDFMPDNDVAILRVQQDLGGQAIISALRDLGRMAQIHRELKSAAMSSIGVGAIALLIALLSCTALPIWAVSVLQENFRLAPEQWGYTGQRFAAWANFIESTGPLLAVIVIALVWALAWSPNNWTGPARQWADKHILLYRAKHEIFSMRTALVLATLARKNAKGQLTLRQSLEVLLQSTRTPWAQWQIERIITRIVDTGAADHSVFDSGIFSQEMYWRLQDVSRSKPLDVAMQTVADTVPKIWLPRLKTTMTVWRWVLMVASVVIVFIVVGSLQVTVREMKTALMNTIGM